MRVRRSDVAAVGFLALLPVLFFHAVISGERAFYARDVLEFHHPSKMVLREIVRGGEFPYWNPYFSAGQPLAANPQNELFYPLTWMIFGGDFEIRFQLLILVHILISLLAMYALLRSLEIRAAPAAAGAIAFGLGGIALSATGLLPVLFCDAWLPLTCLFSRRFLLQHQPRDFGLGALFFGIQCLIGEPATILQTVALIGAYAAARGLQERSIRPLYSALAIGAGGVGVAAAQILPAIDHFGDSVRQRGLAFELVSQWSTPFSRIPEWFYPSLFGHTASEGGPILYWGGTAYGAVRAPFFYSIYAGLLVSVMAAAGFVTRQKGWRLALTLLAGSIAVAAGSHTPLLALAHRAGFDWLRYPERFLFLGCFAMMVFGCRTLQSVIDGDRRVWLAAVGISAAAGTVALALRLVPLSAYSRGFVRFWDRAPSILTNQAIEISRTDWLVAAIRCAALVLVLLILPGVKRPLQMVILAGFMIADVAPLVREIARTTDASIYRTTPIAAQKLLRIRRDFRIFHQAQWEKLTPTGMEHSRNIGDEPGPLRNAMFPRIPADFGLATVMESDYDLSSLRPAAEFVECAFRMKDRVPDWPQPFAAMSNAWIYAVYRPFSDAFTIAGGDVRRMQPVAFLPLRPMPRYYFADRLVTIRDSADFIRRVSAEPITPAVAFIKHPAWMPANGVVRSVASSANHIRLGVWSSGRGFLVLSVTPHKYWRATMDGREIGPVSVNIGYQGFEIPPGEHVLEMRYRNPRVFAGIVISLATLTALVAIIGRMRAP